MHNPYNRSIPRTGLRARQRRVRAVGILPTLITLGNAVCGFVAITCIAAGMAADTPGAAALQYQNAGGLILLGMVFDALDGKVARMTRTASSFGTQLDSLCDFLTFGVAPAFLTYGLCSQGGVFGERVVLAVTTFYFSCAATRLARFNVETGTEEKFHREFSGLPSPAAAGVVASTIIPWTAISGKWAFAETLKVILQGGLPVTMFLLGVLMVSRITYPHFLNKIFGGVRPFVRLIELAVVGLLGVIFQELVLFLAFFGYTVMGPLLWMRRRMLKRPKPATSGAAPNQMDRTLP